MSAQHTRGPWTVHLPSAFQRYIWIDAPGNNGILKIEPCDHGDDLGERFTDEDKANAYLFAAAPELLGALEIATEELEYFVEFARKQFAFDGDEAAGLLAVKNARAAIAKAKGGAA